MKKFLLLTLMALGVCSAQAAAAHIDHTPLPLSLDPVGAGGHYIAEKQDYEFNPTQDFPAGKTVFGYNITTPGGNLVGKFITPGLSYMQSIIDTIPEAERGASTFCNRGATPSCPLYLKTPGIYHLNVLLLEPTGLYGQSAAAKIVRNPLTQSVTLPKPGGGTYQAPGPGPAVMQTYVLKVVNVDVAPPVLPVVTITLARMTNFLIVAPADFMAWHIHIQNTLKSFQQILKHRAPGNTISRASSNIQKAYSDISNVLTSINQQDDAQTIANLNTLRLSLQGISDQKYVRPLIMQLSALITELNTK